MKQRRIRINIENVHGIQNSGWTQLGDGSWELDIDVMFKRGEEPLASISTTLTDRRGNIMDEYPEECCWTCKSGRKIGGDTKKGWRCVRVQCMKTMKQLGTNNKCKEYRKRNQ